MLGWALPASCNLNPLLLISDMGVGGPQASPLIDTLYNQASIPSCFCGCRICHYEHVLLLSFLCHEFIKYMVLSNEVSLENPGGWWGFQNSKLRPCPFGGYSGRESLNLEFRTYCNNLFPVCFEILCYLVRIYKICICEVSFLA